MAKIVDTFLKRTIDIAVSFTGLVLLLPILGVVAVLVAACMGRPVLFSQVRPGRNLVPFTLYKFRSMRPEDQRSDHRSDAARLTGLGRVLRRTSLDELPQLVNILRGDMSLVGPRPLLQRYVPYFTDEERHRFNVRPGLTGWAQIHGRNRAAWTERLAMDVWYVANRSLLLDLRILCLTAKRVFSGLGVVQDANTVMADLDVERRDLSTRRQGEA